MKDDGAFILHPSSLILHNAPTRPSSSEGSFRMERFSALIGFLLILAIAYALSNNKHAIRWKTVMWGLILQIVTAIAVLKGELISQAFGFPGSQPIAALIFIAVAVVVYFVAKRLPETTRHYLWYGFGVFAAVVFLAYNLLK